MATKYIFIVTAGSYEDYDICAVFNNEILAQEYIESERKPLQLDMRIEKREINSPSVDNVQLLI